jgi:hypothetical protein
LLLFHTFWNLLCWLRKFGKKFTKVGAYITYYVEICTVPSAQSRLACKISKKFYHTKATIGILRSFRLFCLQPIFIYSSPECHPQLFIPTAGHYYFHTSYRAWKIYRDTPLFLFLPPCDNTLSLLNFDSINLLIVSRCKCQHGSGFSCSPDEGITKAHAGTSFQCKLI